MPSSAPELAGVTAKGFSAASRRAFDEWISDANYINSTRSDARQVREHETVYKGHCQVQTKINGSCNWILVPREKPHRTRIGH